MTKPLPKCIFFDVDGVLLDSLPQHLQICRDLAAKYQLPLTIPTVPQMRMRISAGLVVSPMREFFLAVGFPPDLAARALDEYQFHFAERYQPQLFPGVPEMLGRLHQAGLPMGLVTANTRENVEPALRSSMDLFDPRCLFFYHPGAANITKTAALTLGAQRLGATPAECVYVGDQPSDETAAVAADCQFLGVTFGWGITGDEGRFDVARNISDIPNALLGATIMIDPDFELDKLRFDYGWKWFAFHAEQRTKMFNFFILAVGILATAVFSWYHQRVVAGLLCIAGALVSFIFSRLDRRNQDLVAMGEEILAELERRRLFGAKATFELRSGAAKPFGILWRQAQEDILAPPSYLHNAIAGKHRIWLRGIAYLALLLFLAAFAGIRLSPTVPAAPDCAVVAAPAAPKPPGARPAPPPEDPKVDKESKGPG